MTDRAAQMSPRCFSSAHVHVKWDSSGRCRPLVHHCGRQMRSKYDRSAIAHRSRSSMSRSRLATQVSVTRRRCCDDHEICARSRSRMMLELVRERDVIARPMRIAPDQKALGAAAPSSTAGLRRRPLPAFKEPARDPPLAYRFWAICTKGAKSHNDHNHKRRTTSKSVLPKKLFLDSPRRPRPTRTTTPSPRQLRNSKATTTWGDHSPHTPYLLSALKTPSGRLYGSAIHRLSAMLPPRPSSACNTSRSAIPTRSIQ